ncbi:hypothetical protein SEA_PHRAPPUCCINO_124 [Mycobacterium phage Phrappuccino]|uniref:Uncharacterized protein n=1 Tax=Mycobacterium phage Phrappuccino TaxID=2591223 RepID=A0A514DDV7_9CAUD|nr:hypothetical protein KHQ87_gp124 [Mycobacterium phage Phrappuccino]QDH91799.1 hypothetical protein SEA_PHRAPPUCCINO_124 [Mycobacterium phage Phrappuccino]QIQ63241.1 hypothetical protein SEA_SETTECANDELA_124 [Mycobacterium phage Settecandela]
MSGPSLQPPDLDTVDQAVEGMKAVTRKFLGYHARLHPESIVDAKRVAPHIEDMWDVTLTDGRTVRVQAPNSLPFRISTVAWPEVRDGVVLDPDQRCAACRGTGVNIHPTTGDTD